MARDAQALKIRPWAVAAETRQDPEAAGIERAQGWDVRYEQIGGETPERKVFNQLLHELAAFAHTMNTTGLLEWSAGVNYVHTPGGRTSFVRGSDGLIYGAVAYSGPLSGHVVDPVTDTAGAYWQRQ